MGRKPGFKASKGEREAGAKNLQTWKEVNPREAATVNLKHGAYSPNHRRKYHDKRTREGKILAQIMQEIEEYYAPITPPMRQIIGSIRRKLILSDCIGSWLDCQSDLVNKKGEPLPCITTLLKCDEGLERSYERLNQLATKRPKRIPTIHELIEAESNEES